MATEIAADGTIWLDIDAAPFIDVLLEIADEIAQEERAA